MESHEIELHTMETTICDRHMQNYFNDYAKPFSDDGISLSYVRKEDQTPVKGADGKPMFYDNRM